MAVLSTIIKALPLWAAASAVAAPNFPTIPKDKTTPVQQRLAIAGPDTISVGWNTYEQLSKPCVKFGTSESDLSRQACSTSSVTYHTSRTWANTVLLTNLTPDTTYYYKIGSTNSTTDFFLSPRTVGNETPYNTSVVIDMGVYGENGYTTSKRSEIPQIMPELNHTTIASLARNVDVYDFVLHPGDFAYADDWQDTKSNIGHGPAAYEAILENFYDQLAPISARKAYMAAPGNHEADCTEDDYKPGDCPMGQYNFTDFMNRFGKTTPLPFPSTSKNKEAQANATKAKALALPPFWYSFEYGMTHYVMFDTETDFRLAPDQAGGDYGLDAGPFARSGQQKEFLRADLASVDRSITPWVVVAGHRPWYSTGGPGNICAPCQAAFEQIFYHYGVDLALFGHVHNSQRFAPVHDNVTDPNGLDNPTAPMYIVSGGAGNIEGLSPVGVTYPGNVFAYAADYSYSRLRFFNRTHLGVDFYRSRDDELLDSSVLYKKHNKDFVINN